MCQQGLCSALEHKVGDGVIFFFWDVFLNLFWQSLVLMGLSGYPLLAAVQRKASVEEGAGGETLSRPETRGGACSKP